jgi:hypothetical protein
MSDYDEEWLKTGSLELVKKLAQEAQIAEVLDIEDGRTKYIRIGNEVHTFAVPPPERKHQVMVLDDLIKYVMDTSDPKATVWHNEEVIVALLDDADRRDTLKMPLFLSERLETLKTLEKNKPVLNQKELLFFLRYKLGFKNTSVINQFRKLDWVNSSTDSSNVNFANAKLGKSIIAEVSGFENLPEEIRIDVPVYTNSGESQEYAVICGIEIDTFNHSFQLIPLPDEINRIIDLAQTSIRERLESGLTGVGLYYGTP